MEANENDEICSYNDFLLLLAKKRRLLDLREDLLARRQRPADDGNMKSDNPDSPMSSVTQASITPPPFSPLTPLITKTINNQGGKEFCESNPDTPLLNIPNDFNISSPIPTPLLQKNIENEPLSSPLPPMSPETQKLFKVLTETESLNASNTSNVIENSDISDQDGNCDDSVADPDFDINLENESPTDCESYDEDEETKKKGKTLRLTPKKRPKNEGNVSLTPKNKKAMDILKFTSEEVITNNKENTTISPKDEKKNLRSTPKKKPRIESNVSLTPKNQKVMDKRALKFTPEKETRNGKGNKSDIRPNDEHGTLKSTPEKLLNIECLDILASTPEKEINNEKHRSATPTEEGDGISISTPVIRTREEENNNLIPTIQILEIGTLSPENAVKANTIAKNKKVMNKPKITSEKVINNDKKHTTISPKDEKETLRSTPKKKPRIESNVSLTPKNKKVMDIRARKFTPEKETRNGKGNKSDMSPNNEHGTLKSTPEKSTGHEENDSPVLNIECLDILASTPEKEINNEEHRSATPTEEGDGISISTPVIRTREEENNNLIPTIQIQERTKTNAIGNNDLVGTMSPENVSETNTTGNNDQVSSTSELNTGRPKKGRKRKYPETYSERKFNKYNNLQYTTVFKQKEIEPKVFVAFKCKCLKKCYSLISEQTRKEEFEKFVKLGSYKAQLMYIGSCVKEERKKRSYTLLSIPTNKKKPRQFNRTYTLKGIQVCRDMFLNTLQITTQKVTITLKKMRNNNLNDGRGSTICGWNKITDDQFNFIVEVITKLPKYESHYCREKGNDALYLEPGMTFPKIYEIYQKMFAEKFGPEKKCVSFGCVKKIFLTKFNLRCKSLKKDTCNKCDLFAVQLQNAKSSTEKKQIEADKSTHLEKADTMRNQMKRDFKNAQENEKIECLSFDLEKTLPLPRIPTNVVFYKRQLWFYNSGIHSASDDVGHCYVWVEGEAGRGAQEVGSCLIKYIETKLRPTAEHLLLWSDCCGGQNRNIKIVLMLKAILNDHPTLKKISFRYLESGHTFLPNDTDFSKIETALKKQQRVYTAEEYIHIIRNAKKRNPFQVYKMKKTDFYGIEEVEKKITNRKKFTDKTKVNWLQAKEILIEKEKPYCIFMRSSLEENFMELNIQKTLKGGHFAIDKSDFTQLWPNGKEIAPAKLADLQSLFKYIPADCVQFYKQLKASEDIIDDVDGFGGETDFIPYIED